MDTPKGVLFYASLVANIPFSQANAWFTITSNITTPPKQISITPSGNHPVIRHDGSIEAVTAPASRMRWAFRRPADPDEPSVPATIFINHDIELNKDTDEIREYKKIEEDDYVISPERTYSHSDTED